MNSNRMIEEFEYFKGFMEIRLLNWENGKKKLKRVQWNWKFI